MNKDLIARLRTQQSQFYAGEIADALEAQDKLIEQMHNSLVWAADCTDIKATEFYRYGDVCTCPVCEAIAAYERYKEKA